MNITVHSPAEARALTLALAAYFHQLLVNAGYLHEQENESPYYTEIRELMRHLEKHVSRGD